jgi:hypothetical protein
VSSAKPAHACTPACQHTTRIGIATHACTGTCIHPWMQALHACTSSSCALITSQPHRSLLCTAPTAQPCDGHSLLLDCCTSCFCVCRDLAPDVTDAMLQSAFAQFYSSVRSAKVGGHCRITRLQQLHQHTQCAQRTQRAPSTPSARQLAQAAPCPAAARCIADNAMRPDYLIALEASARPDAATSAAASVQHKCFTSAADPTGSTCLQLTSQMQRTT